MSFTDTLVEAFNGIFSDRGKPTEEVVYKKQEQIVPKDQEDGGYIEVSPSGFFGVYLDTDNKARSDSEYISLVRNLSFESEYDYAISEIVNELVVIDEDEKPIKIDLEDVEVSETIKAKITKEFDNILTLLNFTSRGYDIVRQWYVDGRLYYHVIIDEQNTKKGIVELRNIDPRKIKKIKEVERENGKDGIEFIKSEKEWFLFSDKQNGGYTTGTNSNNPNTFGLKIHPDRVAFVHSGLKNPRTNTIVSHLFKSIKRFNQLRLLEESVIIYRFSRAPERRVFYIDTGNMPPKKGEKYVHDLMAKHKNKIVYDQTSGEVTTDKRFMTMLDDYWLPRNSNGSGTKIETLSGSQLSNGMEDVNEFRKQFYLSLNVPISRLEPESGFSLGRASEISREEVKFARFCTRLRIKFSDLFDSLLEKQLILKNIVRKEDWDLIKQKVKYKYNVDTHFKELLDQEVLQSKLRLLQDIEAFTPRAFNGTSFPMFSVNWVKKHVLLQSEAEIQEMEQESSQEMLEIEELVNMQAQMEQEQALQQTQQ